MYLVEINDKGIHGIIIVAASDGLEVHQLARKAHPELAFTGTKLIGYALPHQSAGVISESWWKN